MSGEYRAKVHDAPSAAKQTDVLDLFREWKHQHEEKRVFVRQDELITYQASLNEFIAKAERVKAAVEGKTLSGARFGDSIAAAEQLIDHAKHKRSFFDGRFVTLGRESNTFARIMTFDEQRMVPQAKDIDGITEKIKQLKTQDAALPELTPSQAWALVAANLKGKQNEWANMERAVTRLQDLNKEWKTSYGAPDLVKTLLHMTEKTRIATQYRMEKPVGEQQAAAGTVPLYKLLMESGFRNLWETGTSQASADKFTRGAIEEQMGYGAALRRTGGRPQDRDDKEGTFDPKDPGGRSTAAEMPRYAATIGDAQQAGVAVRYGTSYIVWKESVRNRVTWTPGDSWSTFDGGVQGVKNYVSLEHPEIIFAHADKDLLRMFMAEATGKDSEWLQRLRKNAGAFAAGGAYIETQIHGDLTWADVAEVVLDARLPNVVAMRAEFETFKRTKNLAFTVRTHGA
jgi:hypothetical protein